MKTILGLVVFLCIIGNASEFVPSKERAAPPETIPVNRECAGFLLVEDAIKFQNMVMKKQIKQAKQFLEENKTAYIVFEKGEEILKLFVYQKDNNFFMVKRKTGVTTYWVYASICNPKKEERKTENNEP